MKFYVSVCWSEKKEKRILPHLGTLRTKCFEQILLNFLKWFDRINHSIVKIKLLKLILLFKIFFFQDFFSFFLFLDSIALHILEKDFTIVVSVSINLNAIYWHRRTHSKNWMENDMLSGDGIYVVTCLAKIEIEYYIWIGDMLFKLVSKCYNWFSCFEIYYLRNVKILTFICCIMTIL